MLAYSHPSVQPASSNLVSTPERGYLNRRPPYVFNDNGRRDKVVTSTVNNSTQNAVTSMPVYSHDHRQASCGQSGFRSPSPSTHCANTLRKSPRKNPQSNLASSNVREFSKCFVTSDTELPYSTPPAPFHAVKNSPDRYKRYNRPSTPVPHVMIGSSQHVARANLNREQAAPFSQVPLRSYNGNRWFNTRDFSTPENDSHTRACYPIHETSPTELLEYSFTRQKSKIDVVTKEKRHDSLLSNGSQGASPARSITSSSVSGTTQHNQNLVSRSHGLSSRGSISMSSVAGSLRRSRNAVRAMTHQRSASVDEPSSHVSPSSQLRSTSSFSSYGLQTRGSIRHARRRASYAASDVATQARGFRRYIKDSINSLLDPKKIRVEAHVVKKRLQRWADIDASHEQLTVYG